MVLRKLYHGVTCRRLKYEEKSRYMCYIVKQEKSDRLVAIELLHLKFLSWVLYKNVNM